MNPLNPTLGNIPLEELASLPSFYLPTVSHSRKKIAFYWDKGGSLELYVMGTRPGDEPRQVSEGQLPKALHAGFVWSKDDRNIYFAKDTDGDEQHNIWRIDAETGDAEQLTDTPQAQEYPVEVGPDNRTLYILSNKDDQLNLYAFDLEQREYTRLTHFANPVWDAKLSPDGQQMVFLANETDNLKNLDVYLMDLPDGTPRRIIQMAVGSRDAVGDWSKDGRYLSMQSDVSGAAQAGVYEMTTGQVRWFTPEGIEHIAGDFSPNGERMLVYRNADSAVDTVVYNVQNGQAEPVELPHGMSYNAQWVADDRFVVNIMTDVSRAELRDYHLEDGQSEVLIPAEYGSIDPAVFASHDYVWYPSTDGTQIPAIVYKPKNMAAGQTYPAIVHIHGGPTYQWFRGFDTFAQFLADRGFIVFEPNVRGSTGYGVKFRDACLKDWGGKDLEDVEGAVNYLREMPEVDPARIGVFGGSYGGYMTFMSLTKKPHLWKAGVAWVGITDLHAMYEESMEHFKYFLREQMGDPEADAELWRDRSAINFAHQLTAPLLIVHGVNDPRCPISQARTFRDKLLELGKTEGEDFEYVELGEEGHGSTDIGQKIRAFKLLADFMERRL
jgi:dipeptidyl aminopeptidase/acylaminoacyl peptidase